MAAITAVAPWGHLFKVLAHGLHHYISPLIPDTGRVRAPVPERCTIQVVFLPHRLSSISHGSTGTGTRYPSIQAFSGAYSTPRLAWVSFEHPRCGSSLPVVSRPPTDKRTVGQAAHSSEEQV